MTENLYTPDCIRTYTGKYVNVFEPTVDMIDIEDIAHGLSHQPRFAGHTKQFFSVAQHSVNVMRAVPDFRPELKTEALLHDASEAYLCDIPKPIKARMPEYKVIEDRLMAVIAEKFGFTWPMDPDVKLADEMLLNAEWNYVVLSNRIDCWSSELAKNRFLYEFKLLNLK